jgi:hypothetical protein
MDKNFAKRLKKIVPENGGFDLSFSMSASGIRDKVASTLHLTVFAPGGEGKGPIITTKVSIPSIADSIELANAQALEDTLTLLGV